MKFRRKLMLMFALTVVVSVAAVAFLVSAMARSAFTKNEDQRTAALLEQFQRQFQAQGDEVARKLDAIANSESVARMAASLESGSSGSAAYFDLAKLMAENYGLDFVEFVDGQGSIVSSAQSPARFGYAESGFTSLSALAGQPVFLKQEDLPDGSALGIFAVRRPKSSEQSVYAIGGRELGKNFLSTLTLPVDMRVFLYENRSAKFSPGLFVQQALTNVSGDQAANKLEPLIDAARIGGQEMTAVVHWTGDATDDEMFHAIPLLGKVNGQTALAVLLVGNSRRSYVELERRIRSLALLVGGSGMILAILLSSWAAGRVTRPVERLANAAHEVSIGNWDTRVSVSGNDELSQLAAAFNRMTAELLNQRERLVQAERVAAWRELARRLAHELKNPLFPLQLTVENLVRAHESDPAIFDEIFRESASTLLAEISNLKTVIGRFSEFSKMPQPQLQPTNVNDIVRRLAALFRAQFEAPGKPIVCALDLDESLAEIPADPELLHRAISNLVLNAMDAMPAGGTLTLRTRPLHDTVQIEISDTGSGLTREECERIFTPYYTSKQHGTGLGSAIVQSVISDHHGTIKVESEPEKGTRFVIELPRRR